MEKKVRIRTDLLKLIKKVRTKSTPNKVRYTSDKQFVEIAVMNLLKEEKVI